MTARGFVAVVRAIAARLCDSATMEHVIEPTLADFDFEADEAARRGQRARCCWLHVALAVSIARAVVASTLDRVVDQTIPLAAADERQTLRAMMITAGVATAVAVVLLWLPTLGRFDWLLGLYLVPMTIPIALPVGLTVGILAGMRGAHPSHAIVVRLLAMAMLATIVSFATLGWIVPESNQAFRQRAWEQVARVNGFEIRPLARGVNELKWIDLRERVRTSSLDGIHDPAAAFAYYQMWTLPLATLILALFAAAVARRWRVRAAIGSVAAITTLFAHYSLIFAGRQAAMDGALGPATAAWLPDLCVVAGAIAIELTARRKPA